MLQFCQPLPFIAHGQSNYAGGFANGTVTMVGAEARHESRGAQAHDDFPERDDANWMKHTLAWCDKNGNVRLDYRPVRMQTMTNEVSVFPPRKRVY